MQDSGNMSIYASICECIHKIYTQTCRVAFCLEPLQARSTHAMSHPADSTSTMFTTCVKLDDGIVDTRVIPKSQILCPLNSQNNLNVLTQTLSCTFTHDWHTYIFKQVELDQRLKTCLMCAACLQTIQSKHSDTYKHVQMHANACTCACIQYTL